MKRARAGSLWYDLVFCVKKKHQRRVQSKSEKSEQVYYKPIESLKQCYNFEQAVVALSNMELSPFHALKNSIVVRIVLIKVSD